MMRHMINDIFCLCKGLIDLFFLALDYNHFTHVRFSVEALILYPTTTLLATRSTTHFTCFPFSIPLPDLLISPTKVIRSHTSKEKRL